MLLWLAPKKVTPYSTLEPSQFIGELIGKCVREGVKTAIYKQENIWSDRSLVERLADRCLSLETIILQASDGKITKESPSTCKLKKQLESILSDGKIVPLVIAALRLDEDLAKGLMPKKSADVVGQDLFVEIVESVLTVFLGCFFAVCSRINQSLKMMHNWVRLQCVFCKRSLKKQSHIIPDFCGSLRLGE